MISTWNVRIFGSAYKFGVKSAIKLSTRFLARTQTLNNWIVDHSTCFWAYFLKTDEHSDVSICFKNLKFSIIFNSADWLKTCTFKNPNFTQCSTTSVHGLFSHLIEGIEGINGLDTIDPMKIDRIRILQGDGPVSVNASLSKVTVTGFSKLKLIENQVSSKDYSWLTTLTLPKLRLEGNYHMQGRILVIPLNVSTRWVSSCNYALIMQPCIFQGRGKCYFEPCECAPVTLKRRMFSCFPQRWFFPIFSANLQIKFYTKTKLYAKNDHTFYNVTGCKGTWVKHDSFKDISRLLFKHLKNSLALSLLQFESCGNSFKIITSPSTVQFTMDGLKLRLDNLFEGVKVLGEHLNQLKSKTVFHTRLNGLKSPTTLGRKSITASFYFCSNFYTNYK